MKLKAIENRIQSTYRPIVEKIANHIDLIDHDIILKPDTRRLPSFIIRFALRTMLVVLFAGLGFFIFRTGPESSVTVLAKSTDIVAFEAVSSTDLLVQTAINQATSMSASGGQVATLSLVPTSAVGDELSTLNYYLNMIEQFLANQSSLNVTLSESELPEYDYKIVYQSTDLSGKPITYALYYNETSVTDSTTFVFNEEDSDNATVWLQGQITIQGTLYLLEGKKIVDGTEEIYSLYSYLDTADYVYVRYETDQADGVKKFFYTVVQNGQTLNKSKIQVDTESNALVTNLEFVEGNAKGKYRVTRGDNGNSQHMDVAYEIQGPTLNENGQIRIDIVTDDVTGDTRYAYTVSPEDGEGDHQYEADRHDSFDEHEDDHEDEHEEDHDGTHPDDHEDEPEDDEAPDVEH